MESTIKADVKITLTLDQTEARWLRDLCQNAWTPDESEKDKAIRAAFFAALRRYSSVLSSD